MPAGREPRAHRVCVGSRHSRATCVCSRLRVAATSSLPTIEPLDAAYGLYTSDPAHYANYNLGNRVGMTQLDANQLADMYSCVASTLTTGECTDTHFTDQYGQGCAEYIAMEASGYISSCAICERRWDQTPHYHSICNE